MSRNSPRKENGVGLVGRRLQGLMECPSGLASLLGHELAFVVVCPAVYVIAAIGALTYGSTALTAILIVLLFILPALHYTFSGPTVWIENTVSVRVNAPYSLCSAFICEPRNLGQYEQKVAGCSVRDPEPTGCKFTIWGSWFGLPWYAISLTRWHT